MTVKEYLHQAYRLDQRINSNLEELAALREMASSISSPQLSERVQTSKQPDSPFVRNIEKIMSLEDKVNKEVNLLMELKDEIRAVIAAVPNTDERMVLRYRYVHNYTWERIGVELHADSRTVRRWHGKALQHVVLPKNPVTI